MSFPGENLVTRMWETLTDKGMGALLSPWQIGREGRARLELRKHEIVHLAQAEKDAEDIRAGRKRLDANGRLLLTQRVEGDPAESSEGPSKVEPALLPVDAAEISLRAVSANAMRSEVNASKAILFAEEQLAGDAQAVPTSKPDDDWLHVWRENAGKVSAEDLQRMWGSVLAGEVKAPGTHSLRTLDALKNLSKAEAELISRLAPYAIEGRIWKGDLAYFEKKGITFSAFLKLQELGMLTGVGGNLNTTFKSLDATSFTRALVSHTKVLVVEKEDPTASVMIEVYILTEVGAQIMHLGFFDPDVEYLKLLGIQIARSGFQVKLADWRNESANYGSYHNPVDVVPPPPPEAMESLQPQA